MIRSALLILCVLILQFDSAGQPKVEKSSRVKFGGKMPFRDAPFVFENGEFTFVVGVDYNSGASRLVLKLAKFNKKLKCIKKLKYKFKRNTKLEGAGYRYIQSGSYLSIFYSERTNENTKIYSQKVNLEDMKIEGKSKLLVDLNSSDQYFLRNISCVKSPDGNFMLIVIDGPEIQAQYMYDSKENLVYIKRNELRGYKLYVTNEGRVVGIKDDKDIVNNDVLMQLEYKKSEQGVGRFILLIMDKEGKAFYKNYTPEENIYHRYRQWINNSINSTYNGITQRTEFFNSSTTYARNQLSYKFQLKNNVLYFVSFVTCKEESDKLGFEFTHPCNGIFVSKFEITDTFKNLGKSMFEFKKEQVDNLLDQAYSFNKSSMTERIREVKNFNTCNGNGFPGLYMDWVDVDVDGNLSVFGSSYINNTYNIYISGYNDASPDFPYERKNYYYFRIDKKDGLEEATATASIMFKKELLFKDEAFLMHSNKNEYSVVNIYKSHLLILKRADHDNSKKLKSLAGVENYFIWSASGTLYRITTKNLDVVLHLYRISP